MDLRLRNLAPVAGALAAAAILAATPAGVSAKPDSISAGEAFGAPAAAIGESVALTFEIWNGNPSQNQTNIRMTATLDAGLVVAAGAGGPACNGGSFTATAGSNTVSMTGGSLGDNARCYVSVSVKGTTDGIVGSHMDVVSNQDTDSTYRTIAVGSGPGVAVSFGPARIEVGEVATVTYTFANPNPHLALRGVFFEAAPLPAGLEVASPNGAVTDCDNAYVDAPPGATAITVVGDVAPNGTCATSLSVTGTAEGTMRHSVHFGAFENGLAFPADSNTATLQVGDLITWAPTAPPTGTAGATPRDGGGAGFWLLIAALASLPAIVSTARRRPRKA